MKTGQSFAEFGCGAFIDISPVISEITAVFPGDVPFRRKLQMDFLQGQHLRLSSMETTLHIGAHADAPSHYRAEGNPIDERSMDLYVGPCQVITVGVARGARIKPADLPAGTKISAARVLFKTGTFPDSNRWNEDYASLSTELIHFLADRGVRLVGIDTPSVDPHDSKKLEAHQALFERDVANLEGIRLEDVPDGHYLLIALPLRLLGADASPVRAVLIQGSAISANTPEAGRPGARS